MPIASDSQIKSAHRVMNGAANSFTSGAHTTIVSLK